MKKTFSTLAVTAGSAAAVLAPAAAFAADDSYGPAKTIAVNIPGVINTSVTIDTDVSVTLLNFVHLTLNIFPTLFGF